MRLRATALLKVLLASFQIGVDLGLVPQVIGNCAVDLFKAQSGKTLSDRFGGVAIEETVDDRIQRYTRSTDEVGRLSLFHVLVDHGSIPKFSISVSNLMASDLGHREACVRGYSIDRRSSA